MNYKEKYLKYKEKYCALKNIQNGGYVLYRPEISSYKPPISPYQQQSISPYQQPKVSSYQQQSISPYQQQPISLYQPTQVSSYQPTQVSSYQPTQVSSYQKQSISPYQPTQVSSLNFNSVSSTNIVGVPPEIQLFLNSSSIGTSKYVPNANPNPRNKYTNLTFTKGSKGIIITIGTQVPDALILETEYIAPNVIFGEEVYSNLTDFNNMTDPIDYI